MTNYQRKKAAAEQHNQRYAERIEKKAEEGRQSVNVGTIGHVSRGRSSIAVALAAAAALPGVVVIDK